MPDNKRAMPSKGYPALRRGRFSAAGADYFLTICATRPADHLVVLQAKVLEAARQIEAEGVWRARCGVVMPDHLHLIITLAKKIPLSAGVRLLKGRLSPALRNAGVAWQPGFYDRRLRISDDLLAIFLYTFLNPYRASLCPRDQLWKGYFCCPEDWAWFGGLTRESCPEPEWLR